MNYSLFLASANYIPAPLVADISAFPFFVIMLFRVLPFCRWACFLPVILLRLWFSAP